MVVNWPDQQIPQLLSVIQKSDEIFPNVVIKMLSECYEEVYRFPSIMLPQIHGYAYKYYFRLTPKCAHRVIYRGYMRDKRNRSLGPNLDFIRAFSGYESPMLKDVNELKKRIDYV